jgi:predicted AAA+ superfamily ATPase
LDAQIEKIKKLKEILDLPEYELRDIKKRIAKNESFIWIKRKINPEKNTSKDSL